MPRFAFAATALISLTACMQTAPDDNARIEPDTPGGCPAGAYQSAIGKVVDDVRFDWPADKLRVVGVGQPVTTDFIPDRMTVTYGRGREILLISCG